MYLLSNNHKDTTDLKLKQPKLLSSFEIHNNDLIQPQPALLRSRHKRLRIRGEDIKQSIQRATVKSQYISCGKSCKHKNYWNQIAPPLCTITYRSNIYSTPSFLCRFSPAVIVWFAIFLHTFSKHTEFLVKIIPLAFRHYYYRQSFYY